MEMGCFQECFIYDAVPDFLSSVCCSWDLFSPLSEIISLTLELLMFTLGALLHGIRSCVQEKVRAKKRPQREKPLDEREQSHAGVMYVAELLFQTCIC